MKRETNVMDTLTIPDDERGTLTVRRDRDGVVVTRTLCMTDGPNMLANRTVQVFLTLSEAEELRLFLCEKKLEHMAVKP